MKLKLIAAFCALFLSSVGTALADPALWVVETPNAKVYLFGTVHVMKPQLMWHSTNLDKALADSGDLWLEVANADDVAAAAPLVRSLGMDATHPLSTKLSAPDLARVDKAAKLLGAPGEAPFEPFRPWFASVTFSMLPLIRSGYDPKSGIDIQLKSAFDAKKKPVHGFETLEQQLHFFADLPTDQQVAMLDATLDQVETTSTMLDGLVNAWSTGDVDRFASLTEAGMFKSVPGLYDTLVVRRNADWAQQIQQRLKEPGTSFMAVGAAHLAGTQSVQADLEKLGYHVRRIQ
ncbi:MAG: TraB/GumN family protein [Candidatus Eremiobacteraeota bacterium]|nr:TraB/GumN family protein [Candidatus Eremiobacteraeota bacterium]